MAFVIRVLVKRVQIQSVAHPFNSASSSPGAERQRENWRSSGRLQSTTLPLDRPQIHQVPTGQRGLRERPAIPP
jgi:hypothetical protein